MADDRVEVSITANAAGVQTGAQQAAQSLGQVRASAQQLHDALAATGNNLQKATALLAAQGAAAKTPATENVAAAASMTAATEATGGLRVGTAGVTLTNAGLLTREQIAETMRIVGEQQARQFGDNPSRRLPAQMMRQFMSLPVAEGRGAAKLFVVDGGKPDDPETSA